MVADNLPIVITGCQRSGTTLLNLILDSHPNIRGVDEMEFDSKLLHIYKNSPEYGPYTCFKLPALTHFVDQFLSVSTMKILWCQRDIRDVVSSMLRLQLVINSQESSVAWAIHPLGAMQEIANLLPVIQKLTMSLPSREVEKYQLIERKELRSRSRDDSVFCAAWVWKLKDMLLEYYRHEVNKLMIVKYDDLIKNSEPTLREIMRFLTIDWHDNLLRHHDLHSGISVGNTINTKAIDSQNSGRWRNVLTKTDIQLLASICPNEPVLDSSGT